MSHPIDDIFKKVRQEASLEGHEADWQKAKALLDLKKDKRRGLFWLWSVGGIAAALLVTILLLDYSMPTGETTIQPDFAIEENMLNVPANEIETTEVDDALASQIRTQDQAELDISSNIAVNSEHLQKDAIKPSVQSSRNETLVNEKKKEKTFGISNQSESQELIANKIETLDQIETTTITEIGHPSFVYSELLKLQIEEFEILIPQVDLTFDPFTKVEKLEKVEKRRYFGVFSSFNPISEHIGVGLKVGVNYNAKWSMDLGVGISRSAFSDSRTLNDVSVQSASIRRSQLISQSEYNTFSIHVPVRVFRHFGKHQVFTGLLMERPILLNGIQEVTFQEGVNTVDQAGAPLADPSFSDPIMLTQDLNFVNAEEESKIFVSGILGYGYDLSHKFGLGVFATYRLNDRRILSPLISEEMPRSRSNMGIQFRLDYRF